MTDFTTTLDIDGSPEQVYLAILDTRRWWNRSIEGSTDAVGDEFWFEVEGMHRSHMRIIEAVPGHTVAWEVLENSFGFVADQTEWVGNVIVFSLEEHDGATRLTFTQRGLVPSYECYTACSNAWTFFVGESLRNLVELGHGNPETAAADTADVPRDDFFEGAAL